MTDAETEEALARRFESVPRWLDGDDDLRRCGADFCTTCLIGIGTIPFLVTCERGLRLHLSRGPHLMRSWRFAVRGSCLGWTRFWQAPPPPGWHDLFALAKRGEMTIEGDLHPFMTHLQVIKDLLALPRRRAEA